MWWSRFLRSSHARQVARNIRRTRLTPHPSVITRMWRRLRPDSARPSPSKLGWRYRIRSLNKTGEVAKPARPKRAPDTLARSWRRLPFFRAWNRLRQGGGYRQQPASRAKAAGPAEAVGQAEAAGQAAAVEKGVLARAAEALAAEALAAEAAVAPPPVSPADAMAQWLARQRRSEAGLAIEAAERASLARRALEYLTSRREELPSSAQGLLAPLREAAAARVAPLREAAAARAAAAAERLAGASRHVTAEVRRLRGEASQAAVGAVWQAEAVVSGWVVGAAASWRAARTALQEPCTRTRTHTP